MREYVPLAKWERIVPRFALIDVHMWTPAFQIGSPRNKFRVPDAILQPAKQSASCESVFSLNTNTRLDEKTSQTSKWWSNMSLEDVRNLDSTLVMKLLDLREKELELEKLDAEARLLQSIPNKDRLAAMRLSKVQFIKNIFAFWKKVRLSILILSCLTFRVIFFFEGSRCSKKGVVICVRTFHTQRLDTSS